MGKSEQRELASRMAVLLAQLLKWRYQPERRGNSWENTIRAQRGAIAVRLKRAPSLKNILRDASRWEEIWADALSIATTETGLGNFPPNCPWETAEILDTDWMP